MCQFRRVWSLVVSCLEVTARHFTQARRFGAFVESGWRHRMGEMTLVGGERRLDSFFLIGALGVCQRTASHVTSSLSSALHRSIHWGPSTSGIMHRREMSCLRRASSIRFYTTRLLLHRAGGGILLVLLDLTSSAPVLFHVVILLFFIPCALASSHLSCSGDQSVPLLRG